MIVVFFARAGRDRSKWWHYIVPTDFVHCYAARRAKDGVIIVAPASWGISVEYADVTMEAFIKENEASCSAIVMAPVKAGRERVQRNVFSCVSVVKALLGIDFPFIQRPKALYKEMVSWNDAVLIKPYTPWTGV